MKRICLLAMFSVMLLSMGGCLIPVPVETDDRGRHGGHYKDGRHDRDDRHDRGHRR